MAVTIYQGYSPSTQEPIDDRLVLASQTARYNHPWFETFQGMLVYQVDNAQLWAYSGSNPTNQTEVQNANNWALLGGESGTQTLQDTMEIGSSTTIAISDPIFFFFRIFSKFSLESLSIDKGDTAIGSGFKLPLVISTSIKPKD